jgi:quinol monooxygenase YgiN
MHIQIVTFHLKDMTAAEYRSACDGFAPAFADVPGLLSKAWLADEETNTFGGVYTWVDRAAMDAYTKSDLCGAIAANPNFVDIASRDFSILAGPSAVTRARIPAAA